MEIKKRILVVDDIELNRALLAEALADECELLEAADGKEALELLLKNNRKIDMIISDIVMPVMNGFELLQRISTDEELSRIPFIVVTAMGERENELKALDLGAIDVMVKPIDLRIARRRIKNILQMAELERIQAENKMLKVHRELKDQLQAILNSSMGGIFRMIYDEKIDGKHLGRLVYANDSFFTIRGLRRETETDIYKTNYASICILDDSYKKICADIHAAMEKREKSLFYSDLRIKRKSDGELRCLTASIGFTYTEEGCVMDVIESDVTAQRETEARLKENQDFLETFINEALPHTKIYVWKYDIKAGQFVQTKNSRAFHDQDCVVENVPEILFTSGYIHPDSEIEGRDMYRRLQQGEKVVEGTLLVRESGLKDDFSGRYWWEHTTYTTTFDENGDPVSAIGISEDVTQQIDAEKLYRQEIFQSNFFRNMAEHDSLTGLYSRAAFERLANEILQENMREGAVSAMIMIDADNFKNVNDTLGHNCGDQALACIAETLTKSFREEDIIGRIGGDEFIVLARHIEKGESLCSRMEQICEKLHLGFGPEEKRVYISGSIGVVLAPENGHTFHELYRKADEAMYKAKSGGKNRFVIYGQADLFHTDGENEHRA